MTGRRGAILLFLLVAGVALGGDPPRAGIQRTPRFRRDVDAAIDRGVAWLRKAQQKDGSFVDHPGFDGATTTLAYHTLRVCGVPRDDPAAARIWDAGRRLYAREKLKTYSAAIYLMAIASHGDPVVTATDDRDVHLTPEDSKWAREIAACLAGTQNEEGCWSYFVDTSAEPAGSGAGAAAGAKHRGGVRGYDHSNTQYALLGLKCAARCGVPIDPGVWRRSLEHFLAAQETSGPSVPRGSGVPPKKAPSKGVTRDEQPVDSARGWDYGERSERRVYPSMTAAGVSAVVICRSELIGTHEMTSKLEAESERSVWDGLARLGTSASMRNFAPSDANLPLPFRAIDGMGVDGYEYYGVERAGVLAGVDWMADLDWYGAGASAIVAAQEKDGSWTGALKGLFTENGEAMSRARHVVETCFALLFLKRGTTPVRRGAVTQGGGDDDINFAVAATLEGKDLADFLDLVLARWRRAKAADVKTRLLDCATSTGPRIVEPLLLRMEDADPAVRTSAHALLRHATGQDFGYVADVAPDLREAALALWQKWWMTSKDRLVYDEATRKLVVR